MNSKYTLMIVDHENNWMMKVNPMSLVIGDPCRGIVDFVVRQEIDITYHEVEYVNDLHKYLAELFIETKKRVDEHMNKCEVIE